MSATSRGGAYADHGKYYTDRELAAFLVDRLDLRKGDVVLEPSVGGGAFLEQLIRRNRKEDLELRILIMDIDARAPGMEATRHGICDGANCSFLDEEITWTDKTGHVWIVQTASQYPNEWPLPDVIVGNPPFGIKLPDEVRKSSVPVAEAHVLRALSLAKRHVSFLLPSGWMGSSSRAIGIHAETPPTSSIFLAPRPGFTGTGSDSNEYINADYEIGKPITDPEFPTRCGWGRWK